ncbi:hypothetical protein BDR03DRAFT_954965 [Suillus americanus]|nr:hypothetical protein BDR03DRAFT_954965 [Suillus americanus]
MRSISSSVPIYARFFAHGCVRRRHRLRRHQTRPQRRLKASSWPMFGLVPGGTRSNSSRTMSIEHRSYLFPNMLGSSLLFVLGTLCSDRVCSDSSSQGTASCNP